MDKINQPSVGRYIDPLTDFGFKRLFSSEPSKDLLIAFLNDVFRGRKQIVELEYGKNEFHGDGKDEGGVIFDLLCTGGNGEQFLIEVQRGEQKFFRERALFYTSRLISSQAPRGKRYQWNYELKEVYLIALLADFSVTEATPEGYLHDICLMNRDTGEIFYDKLNYTYIELIRFVKTEQELETNLDCWLYILKHLSNLNKLPVFLRKPIFEKLFHLAEYSNLSKEERMLYDSELKARWDNKNVEDLKIERADAKARQEERAKADKLLAEERAKAEAEKLAKTKSIARNLGNMGLPVADIAKATGLSIEEIEQL